MMTTQSFYRDRGNPESFNQINKQFIAPTYQDRAYPYGFSDLRQDYRAEHEMRLVGQPVNELEVGQGNSPTRKRIAVACARCRKRKIKCSGDPGDGSGCQACRSNGNDISQCTFVRVNSQIVPFIDANTFLPDGSIQSMHQPSSYSLGLQTSSYGLRSNENTRRPSMPILHTRASFPIDYDSQYDHSPLDGYTYSTPIAPRQDSVNTNVTGVDQYQNWNPQRSQSSHTPPTVTTTSMYQEGPAAYSSFNVLQAPQFGHNHSERLSSGTMDSLSSLNMNSLQSSLPSQTTTSRQLPVPHLLRIPSHTPSSTEIPDIRPLNSPNTNCGPPQGANGRSAIPWSSYEDNTRNSAQSSNGLNTQNTLSIPYTAEPLSLSSPAVPEPFGYRIPRPSSSSSDASPTAPASDTQPNHPTTATRYSNPYYPAAMLPPIAAEECRTIGQAAARQYDFNTDADEPHYIGQRSQHTPFELGNGSHGDVTYSRTCHHNGQQQSQYDMPEHSVRLLSQRSSGERQKRSGECRVSLKVMNGKK